MNNVVLAVDLGGTNLRMSAVGSDGTIYSHARTSTPKNATPEEFLQVLNTLADECRSAFGADREVVGIGVGVPANFNAEGVLTHVTNIPSLTGMNLKADISARFGVPVALENDATAATIGENWLGASKEVSDSIMLTLGTGIGGGIIIGNEPFRGVDGTAGRLGHITVEPEGHPCKCGNRGCIEQYGSATAIVRMASEAGLDFNTSFEVYQAARSGNELARSVYQKSGYYLGITLAGLTNALNPEMIVIGGGGAAGWDAFIEPLKKELTARAFHEPVERAKVVRGTLADNAGILGAARSAFQASI
jgi:glucokinase